MNDAPAKNTTSLGKRLLNKFGGKNILLLGLYWLGITNLNYVLSQIVQAVDPLQFGFTIFFGLAGSWLCLVKTSAKSWRGTSAVFLAVLLIIPIQANKSHPIILNMILDGVQGNWSQVNLQARLVFSVYQSFAVEMFGWFAGANFAENAESVTAVVSLWGVVLGCLTVWAAWWQLRRSDPFVALLPLGLILSAVLSYSGTSPLYLLTFFGVLMALMSASHFISQEHLWEVQKTDYSEELRFDIGVFTCFAIILVLGTSLLLSTVPIRGFARLANQLYVQTNQVISEVGSAVGLQKFNTYRQVNAFASTGLPRIHLIGGDPSLSDHVALEIILDRKLPPALPVYWRALTFDVYTGFGWQSSQTADQTIEPAEEIENYTNVSIDFLVPSSAYYILQTVTKFDRSNTLLFGLGEPIRSDSRLDLSLRASGDLYGAVLKPQKYRLISRVAAPELASLQASPSEYPDWILDRYIQLPDLIPERVHRLSHEITDGYRTPFEKSIAIESYLRNFPYSLHVLYPPDGREISDFFLFDVQAGYCDYFATAMVVLLRSAGIPARLVMGYAQGSFDSQENRFIVTEADAHSWVEVYFPGIGWVPFEPTPGLPEITRANLAASENAEFSSPPPLPLFSQITSWLQRIPSWIKTASFLFLLFLIVLRFAGKTPKIISFALYPHQRLDILYFWMIQVGHRFGIPTSASRTPNELAQELVIRIQHLLGADKLRTAEKYSRSIWTIIEAFNLKAYSSHSAQAERAMASFRAWIALQPIIWQGWIVSNLKMIQSRFK